MAARSGVVHGKAIEPLSKSVKHLAWLHAAPDFDKPNSDHKKRPPARIQQFKDTFVAELPDTGVYAYLFSILNRIGIAGAGFNGAAPIGMHRINAWCDGVGAYLYPTERELLIAMSEMYVSHMRKSERPDELPPAAIIDEHGNTDDEYMARKVMIEMGESF